MSAGLIVPRQHIDQLSTLLDVWHDDPELFVKQTFHTDPYGRSVTVDPAQIDAFLAVRDHDRVTLRSGRGVGKTAFAAMLVHWFLCVFHPARVVTAAGSWGHLTEQLWPEIRAWGNVWKFRDAFEYQQMGIFSYKHPELVRASAMSSDKATNVEGAHSPNFLLLIDEAKGLADEIYAAFLASMTGQQSEGTQKVVALSTPPLANIGWFSDVSSSTRWKTVHVSGLDSPRVSRSYVEEIEEEFGIDSPEYQSYVLGEIPEGSSWTVIQTRWFEAAQKLVPKPRQKKGSLRPYRPAVITCDVAREGEDLTAFGVFERDAFSLVRFHDDGKWGWIAHGDLMAVAGRCVAAVKQHHARILVIDDSGLGGGVTDRLKEMQRFHQFPADCRILPVNFGRRAQRKDRFHRKKSELWWDAREAIRKGLIALPTNDQIRAWHCPRGSDFKKQMTGALYTYASFDIIRVLDKRVGNTELTKSLPTKSPDLAHTFILGVRYYLKQRMVQAPPPDPPPGTDGQQQELMRRLRRNVQRSKEQKPKDPFGRKT